MASAMVLTAAQTVFAALQSKELRETCSMFWCKSELEKLQKSVCAVRSILLEVESLQQELSNEGRKWVEELKVALCDVDDLLDEFTALIQRHKQIPGGKISRKVFRFFFRCKQLVFALKRSQGMKKIRVRLDNIVKDFSGVVTPVERGEEKTSFPSYSYFCQQNIIGREDDRDAIVRLLLSDDNFQQQNVSVVTVVGIGGLGKTALAQLVYADPRIRSTFNELRFWVCVSEQFDIKDILLKMGSAANQMCDDNLGLEVLQRKVLRLVQGKRYLLVLDDVWSENRDEWLKLMDFLDMGASGSRILVTSRSKGVARAIGNYPVHELKGLSDENSWNLFKSLAFEQGQEQTDTDLIDIGRAVVAKCSNLPLAITVMGSLLRGEDKSKWQSYRNINLAKMEEHRVGNHSIMSILRCSYNHLTPPLKLCLSYCCVFPNDYAIRKRKLITLWLAEGFLVPCPGKSLEEVGEDYFMTFLDGCFFQAVDKDEYGEVCSFKIQSLVHDLIREVATKDCLTLPATTSPLGGRIHRLSFADDYTPDWFNPSDYSGKKQIMHSFLQSTYSQYSVLAPPSMDSIISCFRHLRVLDLHSCSIRTLPRSLGKLLHLRYFDISNNHVLEMLPESITKLHNLQILKLSGCKNLLELPKGLRKLVSLRHLDIIGCDRLTHMPAGMDKLTCLHSLTMFVVRGENSDQTRIGQLVDLKALVSLSGKLKIIVRGLSLDDATSTMKEASALRDTHLKVLEIECEKDTHSGQGHGYETLLEGLCPNQSLREFVVRGYPGINFPRWASLMKTSLPYLVSIKMLDFPCLEHLPSFCHLPHLKKLYLRRMPYVEFVERDNGAALSVLASRVVESTFFPTLEKLKLVDLPNLKGWWRDYLGEEAGGCLVDGVGSMEQAAVIPSLHHLRYLSIIGCPSMTYFPPCPHLKKLKLQNFNESLTFCMKRGNAPSPATTASSFSNLSPPGVLSNVADNNNSSLEDPILFLEELEIDNAVSLNSLFEEFVQGARCLTIQHSVVESLLTVEKGFQRCSSSLQQLSIYSCRNLKSLLRGGIEHLNNLQDLQIRQCEELDLEEEDGKPWKSLYKLSSLKLCGLPKLVNLPKGFQHLTALQSLSIFDCENLVALPEGLNWLTSLQSLHIRNCPKLKSLLEHIHGCHGLIEICQGPARRTGQKVAACTC